MIFIIAASIAYCARLSLGARVVTTTSYDSFRKVHRQGEEAKADLRGSAVSYAERKAIFQARKKEVDAHNAQKRSWTLTLNRFADWTPAELQSTHGRIGGRWAAPDAGGSSFLQADDDSSEVGSIDTSALARSVDWRTKMNASNFVHDQGACGSCWAHGAVAAVEAWAELHHGIKGQLSTQQVIDCSTNPMHCGGTGGCEGSTAELAMEYIRNNGIVDKDAYNGCHSAQAAGGLKIDNFVRLPTNKASHLLNALATEGPVALSIDAGKLHLLSQGVFSGCQADAIVNHAVLGVGYGHDAKEGKNYWLLKNSWGDKWAEQGYFRVERDNNDDGWNCGIDRKPQDGVFCDNHPDTVPVCGMCGITSDSAYPVFDSKKAMQVR